MDKQIIARESKKKMEEIENAIYIEKEKSKADAHYYKISKMIEAEQKQLTPEFLKRLAIESIANNTKLYFGESIPKFIMENVDRMMSSGVGEMITNNKSN
jgi:erlin